MEPKTQRVKKLLTFPYLMYQTLEKKAQRMGILFPEYIRFLGMKDVMDELERIETVDEETSKRMRESSEAYKKGEYVVYDPSKDKNFQSKLSSKGK